MFNKIHVSIHFHFLEDSNYIKSFYYNWHFELSLSIEVYGKTHKWVPLYMCVCVIHLRSHYQCLIWLIISCFPQFCFIVFFLFYLQNRIYNVDIVELQCSIFKKKLLLTFMMISIFKYYLHNASMALLLS